MNRRIKKKKKKQLSQWITCNFDYYDEKTGKYKTIPVRCYSCCYYESGDSSVGLPDGCVCPVLYDADDNIIEKVNDMITGHMLNLGYGCPYYSFRQSAVGGEAESRKAD